MSIQTNTAKRSHFDVNQTQRPNGVQIQVSLKGSGPVGNGALALKGTMSGTGDMSYVLLRPLDGCKHCCVYKYFIVSSTIPTTFPPGPLRIGVQWTDGLGYVCESLKFFFAFLVSHPMCFTGWVLRNDTHLWVKKSNKQRIPRFCVEQNGNGPSVGSRVGQLAGCWLVGNGRRNDAFHSVVA